VQNEQGYTLPTSRTCLKFGFFALLPNGIIKTGRGNFLLSFKFIHRFYFLDMIVRVTRLI
jgi:hypothetical protein